MKFVVALLVITSVCLPNGCSEFQRPKDATPSGKSAPADVVYVIDGSATMVRSFNDVRHVIARAVADLPPGTRLACIYAGVQSQYQFGPMPSSGDAVRRVVAFLSDIQPEASGSGDIGKAIERARGLTSGPIWVVSDGSLAANETAAARTREAVRADIGSVNTVLHFARAPEDRKFLFELSRLSGGACIGESGQPVRNPPEGYGSLPDVELSKRSILAVPDQ